jgi:hypothetical protein
MNPVKQAAEAAHSVPACIPLTGEETGVRPAR